MKHMFKCTGPGSVVEMPKKPVATGKSKKQKSSSKSATNTICPQNSFKFEPETIIEPADEAYDDPVDDSYMDTHFGDSDNEFEATDSIIAPIEPIVEPSSQPVTSETNAPGFSKAKKSTTCTSLNANANVRLNLNQSIMECRVKLEPIDVSNYAIPSTSTSTEHVEDRPLTVPPLVIPRVPPLTIRIKKEVIQPGYGDFNAELASNIKQERIDESYELAGTTREEYSISHKKSKHRDKEKKLYKKPALLAIKIKQERMERDDEGDNYYPDYSMPSTDFVGTMSNQSLDSNPLPIITQIHSVLEPMSIGSTSNAQPNESQNTITTIQMATNQLRNSVPFVPIRIKSEFHKPLTPPPPPDDVANEHVANNSEDVNPENATMENQIPNENSECDTNLSSAIDSSQQSNTTVDNASAAIQESNGSDSVDNSNEISSNACIPTNVENNEPAELSRIEPVSSTDDIISETQSKVIDEDSSTPTQIEDKIQNEKIQDERPSENACDSEGDISQENGQNEIQTTENEGLSPENVNSMAKDEAASREEPKESELIEGIGMNEENGDSTAENLTAENEKNIDITFQATASVVANERIDSFLDDKLEAETEIEPNLIKPICDELDAVVTNEIMSPIDFIEPNANDDSLNFIDQLVHEVADTMVPQVHDVDKAVSVEENANIPFASSSNQSDQQLGLSGSGENDEHGAGIDSNPIDKSTEQDTLVALSNIDYTTDLLPVQSVATEAESDSEPTINGNNIPTSLPIQMNSAADADVTESVAISNEIIAVDPSKLPLNEPNNQENLSN